MMTTRYSLVFLFSLGASAVYALGDTTHVVKDQAQVQINERGDNIINNNYGIPPAEYLRVAKELGITSERLGVTQKVLDSFLQTVGKKQVPLEKLDSTLTEIAERYKELLKQVASFTSDDPEVKRLLTEAKTALDTGEFDQAEKLYNQASEQDVAAAKRLQEIAEKRLLSAAEAKYANGELKMTQLAYLEAAKYYQQAAELLPEKYAEQLGEYLNSAGYAFYEAGHYTEAQPLLERGLAIREKVLGKEHPDVALSLNNLAGLYRAQGEYDQAQPLFERSLAMSEKVLCKEHPAVASSLNNLAELYYAQGEYDQAKPLLERSLAIREKVLGKEHPAVAQSLNNLAELYKAQGEYDQAKPLFERAVAIFEEKLGKNHPNTKTVTENLHQVQLHLDNPNAQFQVFVKVVSPNSQAAQLGIQAGDIFTHYDNQPVLDVSRFRNKKEPADGPAKELKVLRDGKELIFKIKPGKIGVELKEKVK